MAKMKGGSTLIELPQWNMIVSLTMPLVGIFVNSVEIHVLRRTVNKQYYENIWLCLSLCDLIVGICAFMLSLAVSIVKSKYYILLIWSAAALVFCYFLLINLLHLIIISVDRVWAIGVPFHHRIHASRKKLNISLGLAWCVPMIFVFFHIIW